MSWLIVYPTGCNSRQTYKSYKSENKALVELNGIRKKYPSIKFEIIEQE